LFGPPSHAKEIFIGLLDAKLGYLNDKGISGVVSITYSDHFDSSLMPEDAEILRKLVDKAIEAGQGIFTVDNIDKTRGNRNHKIIYLS
jgi:hypothetical protein